MQFSLYTINPQTSVLSAARAMTEESIPDIQKTPFGTSNVGTVDFYDFDEPLSQENAGIVVKELQVSLDCIVCRWMLGSLKHRLLRIRGRVRQHALPLTTSSRVSSHPIHRFTGVAPTIEKKKDAHSMLWRNVMTSLQEVIQDQ